MFDDELMLKNVKQLLRLMLIRFALVTGGLLFIAYFKPDLAGAIFIMTMPMVIMQVIVDNKINVPKLVTIFFWIMIIMISFRLAGFFGVVGLVLFWIGYFAWRLWKFKDDKTLVMGFDLIKNSRKYAQEQVKADETTRRKTKQG